MSFERLHAILGAIEPHYQSSERQQLQRILEIWHEIVNDAIADHAQPTAIQRNILEVATESPVWTQTLVFERPRLLKKIRERLAIDLSDVRFSTVQWRPQTAETPVESDPWQSHPSRIPEQSSEVQTQLALFSNAKSSFDRWSSIVQSRAQHLPLCPECGSPTPPGELDRWSVCAICAAKC
ncbi:DciA family protein [Leptolyngbya sp. NIES-2104]|uniref:DciA family protein n=1 Tax=Leptolyngbya sp. NIES-2104 TaxID=1552121 RepID=UPI0006EC5DA5|nr:DciA family protein [Leptolyngbya sp. NIES-2104]GAP97355.1 Zn-ribbon-containing, possibly RNA-binding protein and truncated derivatives [Leptolyngbya sp. NIES-2104]